MHVSVQAALRLNREWLIKSVMVDGERRVSAVCVRWVQSVKSDVDVERRRRSSMCEVGPVSKERHGG